MSQLWSMDPTGLLEHRCLEYHYKKLGRRPYFGQWLPLLTTRAEMTCIPLHKTWQINLLWPMDPPPAQVPKQRCLEYQYTKLSRQSYFGQWTLPNTRAEMTCIPLHQMWQMKPMLANRPPTESRINALNTPTQNLQMNLH